MFIITILMFLEFLLLPFISSVSQVSLLFWSFPFKSSSSASSFLLKRSEDDPWIEFSVSVPFIRQFTSSSLFVWHVYLISLIFSHILLTFPFTSNVRGGDKERDMRYGFNSRRKRCDVKTRLSLENYTWEGKKKKKKRRKCLFGVEKDEEEEEDDVMIVDSRIVRTWSEEERDEKDVADESESKEMVANEIVCFKRWFVFPSFVTNRTNNKSLGMKWAMICQWRLLFMLRSVKIRRRRDDEDEKRR